MVKRYTNKVVFNHHPPTIVNTSAVDCLLAGLSQETLFYLCTFFRAISVLHRVGNCWPELPVNIT